MIFLAQTDTTVGFVGDSLESINRVKERNTSKKVLRTCANLEQLKAKTRVPKAFRKQLRRAKKTTFIMPDLEAYRVVEADSQHQHLLEKHGIMYSSSANKTGYGFERDFAVAKADVVVEDDRGLYEAAASSIFRIGKKKQRRIR